MDAATSDDSRAPSSLNHCSMNDTRIAGPRGRPTITKKIAVLIRDRQSEGVRMSLGLTLADDQVDVFVLDREFKGAEADMMNLELLGEMDVGCFSNVRDNAEMEYLSTAEIAARLVDYDHIVPY